LAETVARGGGRCHESRLRGIEIVTGGAVRARVVLLSWARMRVMG